MSIVAIFVCGWLLGLVAGISAVALLHRKPRCSCLSPAPVIEVESAELVPSERGEKHVSIKFHAGHKWLLRFKDHAALSLSREILEDSLSGEWKQ